MQLLFRASRQQQQQQQSLTLPMIDVKFPVLIGVAVLIFIIQELRHFRFGIAYTCRPQSHAEHQKS
jgi:hypothetical protein